MLHCFTLTAWGTVRGEIETGGSYRKRWAKLRLFGADQKFMTLVSFLAFEDVADQIVSYVSRGDQLIITAYVKGIDWLDDPVVIQAATTPGLPHVYIVQDFRFLVPGRIQRPILVGVPPKVAGDPSHDESDTTEPDEPVTPTEAVTPDDDIPY